MPLIERTGAEFYRQWDIDRGNVTAEEQAERWVSHSALEWGDFLGGSSDIQVANARDLPDVLGVPAESDVIHRETGDFGHERHWVRVSPPPTPEEWNDEAKMSDGDGAEEGETSEAYLARLQAIRDREHAQLWEAHVREQLLQLDDYPLFNDETSSLVLEEWAAQGWSEWGRSDLLSTLRKVDDDFADWVAEEDKHEWDAICNLRDRFNYDPWHAEGGEGGVYFDIDAIARVFIPAHVVAWNDHRHDPDFATAADILAEAATVTTERRSGPWEFWREVIAEAIRHSFPKWNDRPAILQSLKDARKYDDDSLRVFADALEECDSASPWPAILRDYANLPAATPEEVTA